MKTPYCSFTIYVWFDCFWAQKDYSGSTFNIHLLYFPPINSQKCCFITYFLNSKWQLSIKPPTHLFQRSLPLFQRFLIRRFMKSRKLLLCILNIYLFFPFLHIALLELRRRLVSIFRISILYPFFSNFHQHLPELNTKKPPTFLSFFPPFLLKISSLRVFWTQKN